MTMTGTVSELWRSYAIYRNRINCRYPEEAGAAPAARLASPNRVAIPFCHMLLARLDERDYINWE
jgi:hypothetical protein